MLLCYTLICLFVTCFTGFLISRNPLEDISNRPNVGNQTGLVLEGGASTSTGVETTIHSQSQTSLQVDFAAAGMSLIL